MILTCNECGAGFSFDEKLLKETGSKVRCSKCKSVFTAYPPSSADQPETASDDGIELKNVDLSEIEGILGMNDGVKTGDSSTKEEDDIDFDFSTDQDSGESTLETALESEKTEELDRDDVDSLLKEDGSPEGTLSLDLSDMEDILKEEEDEATLVSESSLEEEPGFEAGLDFAADQDESEATLEAALETEKTDQLDLADMDNILEPEDSGDVSAEPADEDNFDLELDFSSENGDVASDSEPVVETEETEELDLSDFDNILDQDKEPEAESLSTDEPSELDFDIEAPPDDAGSDFEVDETVNLDLADMENILKEDAETTEESEPGDEGTLDLDLDFDLDDEGTTSDSGQVVETEEAEELALSDDPEPVVETEETEELDLSDFDNILDQDEGQESESVLAEESEPGGEGTLDLDLDFDLDEDSDEAGSDFEMEETAELDLSEMDNILEAEDDLSKGAESTADEEPDFSLDLDLDDETGQSDGTPPTTAAEPEVADDLDFELDLDEDEDSADAEVEIGPELELEETEELSLSDTDDGIGLTEKQEAEDSIDENADELDFALDLGEDEDADNDSLAVELGDAEEFDLSDLDSVLDEEDLQTDTDEEPEELELNLEDDMIEDSDDKASDIQLESTEKFDLSDIDQMIDTDEIEEVEEAELEEVELDYEIDGDAQDFLAEDESVEPAVAAQEKMDDTFDMGALKDGDDVKEPSDFTDSKKSKAAARMKKTAGRKLSAPMRILLILVLLVGGAFGAHEILKSMGIKISFTDAFKKVPYVGDLIKPAVKDAGNLYIDIFEKSVAGKFVDNPKIGTLFVVTGKLKNEYKHSRRFIRVTGKIFKKGRALVKAESTYCGNLLSETELKSLGQVLMTKRLKNRFGDKRINMKVNKGQQIPFMIVFSNIPSGLEEYSVQVAGSEKS
jgi:predicted Zn finger-like uncharacterized protein